MIIGITGKSGSGKTYISKFLESLDERIVSLNIDEVGHKALENADIQKELISAFGDKIIGNNGIDRKKVGDLVFNSRDNMQILTNLTWKYMANEIDKFISENKRKIIILEWILITKTPYFNECDVRVLVDVPYEERLKRAMQRDGISKEAFDLRESSSVEYDLSKFDYVIDNQDFKQAEKMVKKLYDKSIIPG